MPGELPFCRKPECRGSSIRRQLEKSNPNATVASQEKQDKTQSKKNIQVAVGETFDITLEENTTTGYAWSYNTSNGLELVNTKVTGEDTSIIATSHQKTWTIKAEKAGTYTVDFTYGQSFNDKQAP
ncbi:putative secreted protein [Fontibacillus phaseoli]|uniref:Putative secreted protein n=1 Tax=Fontibacillus phaseoli TaxID=1416533 RepID=A0A369BQH2_9BACL|nr:protease inhibitor I42 family protein [Fontibacillus phaseoli]RCX22707.1 putative secreted protein [Fontibacillus phaseoli]